MKLQTLFESILQESMNDLYRVVEDEMGPTIADQYLNVIEKAKDRNLLPHEYRDIGQIIRLVRNDLSGFRELVNALHREMKNRDEQRESKQQRRQQDIFHYRSEDLVVVEPSSFESSCKYGAGTKWCTTMRDVPDHFHEYTSHGHRLVYLLMDSRKFAIQIPSGDPDFVIWNELDEVIEKEEVRRAMMIEYEPEEIDDLLDNLQEPMIQQIFQKILG